jgi:hypothetical protein
VGISAVDCNPYLHIILYLDLDSANGSENNLTRLNNNIASYVYSQYVMRSVCYALVVL